MSDKKLIKAGLIFVGLVVLLAFASVAWAQTVPGEDIDLGQTGSAFIDAISSKQWGLAIGLGIMLIVWAIRTFVWQNIPASVLPWVATAIGALVGFAGAMAVAPNKWLSAIMAGIQAGLAAAGTWGLLKVVRK